MPQGQGYASPFPTMSDQEAWLTLKEYLIKRGGVPDETVGPLNPAAETATVSNPELEEAAVRATQAPMAEPARSALGPSGPTSPVAPLRPETVYPVSPEARVMSPVAPNATPVPQAAAPRAGAVTVEPQPLAPVTPRQQEPVPAGASGAAVPGASAPMPMSKQDAIATLAAAQRAQRAATPQASPQPVPQVQPRQAPPAVQRPVRQYTPGQMARLFPEERDSAMDQSLLPNPPGVYTPGRGGAPANRATPGQSGGFQGGSRGGLFARLFGGGQRPQAGGLVDQLRHLPPEVRVSVAKDMLRRQMDPMTEINRRKGLLDIAKAQRELRKGGGRTLSAQEARRQGYGAYVDAGKVIHIKPDGTPMVVGGGGVNVEVNTGGGEFTDKQIAAQGAYEIMAQSEQDLAPFEQSGHAFNAWVEDTFGDWNGYINSPAYLAHQAAKTSWLTEYLFIKSGKTVTEKELQQNDKSYFPQFGDPPELVDTKRRKRQIATEFVLRRAGSKYEPTQTLPGKDAYSSRGRNAPGRTYYRPDGTPIPESTIRAMTPEERKQFEKFRPKGGN